MKKKVTQVTPYPLRLEPDLYDKLTKLAKAHDRSINKQVAALVREAPEPEHAQQRSA